MSTMMRLFTTMHGKLIKATGKMGGGTDDGSVLVLRHVGAKSGQVRETPLAFLNRDEGYAVVASMAGAPNNPAWYHNLTANPETEVTVDRQSVPVTARELGGTERDEVWQRFRALDERWDKYEAKTERVLPIIALDRR